MSSVIFKNRLSALAGTVIGLLLAGTVGCGGSDLPLVPVSGNITFSGGSCPAPGNVTFTPIDVAASLPRRPASGSFNTDGSFVVTSFRPGDGLLPGRYRVTVTCFSGLPDPTSPDPFGDVSYVQKGYQPPELVIESGSDAIEVSYDVPLKRAKSVSSSNI